MDVKRVVQAADAFLDALGVPLDDEARTATARRVGELWCDLLSGESDDPSRYLNGGFGGEFHEMIAVNDITFHSVCEHHLLPFYGKVSLCYLPGEAGLIAGASNLTRVVEVVSKRLQIQERLSSQIAQAIEDGIAAAGVLVVVRGTHFCMTMRETKDTGSCLVTVASRGVLTSNSDLRREARSLIMDDFRSDSDDL